MFDEGTGPPARLPALRFCWLTSTRNACEGLRNGFSFRASGTVVDVRASNWVPPALRFLPELKMAAGGPSWQMLITFLRWEKSWRTPAMARTSRFKCQGASAVESAFDSVESGLFLFLGVITDIYYLFGVSHRARIYDLRRSRQYLLLAAAWIFLVEGHTGSNLLKSISQCRIISAASVCLKIRS